MTGNFFMIELLRFGRSIKSKSALSFLFAALRMREKPSARPFVGSGRSGSYASYDWRVLSNIVNATINSSLACRSDGQHLYAVGL
jgi:hypothetical protein